MKTWGFRFMNLADVLFYMPEGGNPHVTQCAMALEIIMQRRVTQERFPIMALLGKAHSLKQWGILRHTDGSVRRVVHWGRLRNNDLGICFHRVLCEAFASQLIHAPLSTCSLRFCHL